MTAGGSSLPEVQRLLTVLAVGKRCAEVGTAFGAGAAAIAATARSLLTVEIDPARAAAARRRLASCDNAELLIGDYRELLPTRGPFELLFFDGGGWKAEQPAAALAWAAELLALGGLLVIDDMTPNRPDPDPLRAALRDSDAFVSVEVLTTPETAAIIASKRA